MDKTRGFTLVEMLIVVSIVGILAGIALPSYQHAMQKVRRTAAMEALSAVMLLQERLRADRNDYVADLATLGHPKATHYTLQLTQVTTSGYTVRAVPAPGSPQARDTACAEIGIRVHGGQIQHYARDGNGQTARCWPL